MGFNKIYLPRNKCNGCNRSFFCNIMKCIRPKISKTDRTNDKTDKSNKSNKSTYGP